MMSFSHIFPVPDQTSSFGGLLDMVTDRCSTLGLLFVLAIDYEQVHLRLVSMTEMQVARTSFWFFMYRMLIQLVDYILR